jgi:hypothetical protein
LDDWRWWLAQTARTEPPECEIAQVINQIEHSVPVITFTSIRRGDGCWIKTEADAEGTATIRVGAVWNTNHWCFYEENHDENEECKLCQSGNCVQEVCIFPEQGKVLVIHEPMLVKQETDTMPRLS